MKKMFIKINFIIIIFIVFSSIWLFPQEEIKIKINKGIAMIPVALPDFVYSNDSKIDENIRNEMYRTLWDDVKYSKVFKLVPREYFSYINKFNPNNIIFKDWASIQAKILISCEISISVEKRIILSMKVFDVVSERMIFGRNFGGKSEFVRLIAHRIADEMMQHFGEKPYFTTKIVYVSKKSRDNTEIFIMDYDGKRQRRITYNDYFDIIPSWSSDGEKIIYTSYKHHAPDLYMFNIFTGKNKLISTGGVNYSADWALDDNKIVYTSSKNDSNAEIYVKNMDSGKEKRLTFNKVIDSSPNWSPSGKEIAFTSQRSGNPHIYIMGEDGTNVRRITFEGTYHDNPAWSPDGTRIVFVSRIKGRFDIYLYNVKNNTITKLTENSGRNENPTWSPDGRHIIFSSNRNGNYQLYTMDYDGSNIKRLTSGPGENKMPKWQKSR